MASTFAVPQSCLEVIRAGKWQEALFGTFTLSTAFFESELLRPLQLSGCERITLLADQKGLRDSLTSQARAIGPGLDYRLLPVTIPGGRIFHPKFAYFKGDAEDVLLVGSGNLTPGGHGRNLEVLEMLRSAKDGRAFRDFGRFLRRLLERPDFLRIPAGRHIVEHIAARALEIAETGDADGWPRLVSSLDGEIHLQLGWLAKEHVGVVNCLYVLAPYHHPDGLAVRKLLEQCSARRLLIGVEPANRTTGFPLDSFRFGPLKSEAVLPVGLKSESNRRLHAKWIEIRGTHLTLVVTGSVNATLDSLCSAKNVELAVARLLPTKRQAESFARNATTERSEFPTGTETAPFLWASLEASGRISGYLFGRRPKGRWHYHIESGGEPTSEKGHCDIETDGVFSLVTGRRGALLEEASLQLILERNGKTARGWVDVEPVLEAGAGAKRRLRAMLRALRKEGGVATVGDFLNYIWDVLQGNLGTVHPTRGTRRGGGAGSGGEPAPSQGNDILDALIRSLMATDAVSSEEEVESPDEEVDDTTSDAPTTPRAPRKRQSRKSTLAIDQDSAALAALIHFNGRFYKERVQGGQPRGTKHSPARKSGATVTFSVPTEKAFAAQLAMNLEVLLDRLSVPRRFEALGYARNWLRSVRAQHLVSGEPLLDNLVIGVASTIAYAINLEPGDIQSRWGMPKHELADLVAEFFETNGSDFAIKRLRSWCSSGWAKVLANYAVPADVLPAFGGAFFEGASLDQKLSALVRKCYNGQVPQLNEWPLDEIARNRVAQTVRTSADVPSRLAIVHGDISGCPKCGLDISADRAELRSRRVIFCPNGHLVLWLKT